MDTKITAVRAKDVGVFGEGEDETLYKVLACGFPVFYTLEDLRRWMRRHKIQSEIPKLIGAKHDKHNERRNRT